MKFAIELLFAAAESPQTSLSATAATTQKTMNTFDSARCVFKRVRVSHLLLGHFEIPVVLILTAAATVRVLNLLDSEHFHENWRETSCK